ncbi:hypothetical protein FGRMN_1874 [Fusarium graminum]|nr:hypothetical protein FGRMN_1874 [Fusarium graminum]
MHYPTVLFSIATLFNAVSAAPKQEYNVGVAMMTYNGDDSTPLNVPLGVLTHNPKSGPITELEIARIYSSVEGVKPPKEDQVVCQMYKDQWGTIPGSKEFTSKKSALISTNPVPLGWVLCRVKAN